MKVTTELNKGKIKSRADKASKKAQFILDEQVLKDSNDFAPRDTGTLVESSLQHSRVGSGALRWQTPYARRLYYNPSFNFSRDRNPKASGMWFEKAKSSFKAQWIALSDKVFKSNF